MPLSTHTLALDSDRPADDDVFMEGAGPDVDTISGPIVDRLLDRIVVASHGAHRGWIWHRCYIFHRAGQDLAIVGAAHSRTNSHKTATVSQTSGAILLTDLDPQGVREYRRYVWNGIIRTLGVGSDRASRADGTGAVSSCMCFCGSRDS